jgi:hypothetical protein
MEVERVAVDWELAYAKDFEVRTRRTAEGFVEDPSQWTERGWVRGLKEVNPSAVNDTASQDDAVFDLHGAKVHLGPWLRADATWIGSRPVVARHVMVVPTARGSNNPAVYSIYEIGIAARPHLERTTGRP